MSEEIIPADHIEHSILIIRGQRVMLDSDLASMYGVETKVLNQAVKRNLGRFPKDFMFQITADEKNEVVTNCDHLQYLKFSPVLPYVFTEYGVAMLSSVLKSERAIAVNIEIMRTFGKYRSMLAQNKDLAQKVKEMEKKYDRSFKVVFDALEKLLEEPQAPKKQPIGFNIK